MPSLAMTMTMLEKDAMQVVLILQRMINTRLRCNAKELVIKAVRAQIMDSMS